MQAGNVTVGSIVRLPCNCWHRVTSIDSNEKIVFFTLENNNEYAFRKSDWVEVSRYSQP